MTDSWLDISKQLAETSPVFIVGPPRSGTTILYMTLQRLPAFGDVTDAGDYSESFVFMRPHALHEIKADHFAAQCLRQYLMNKDELVEQYIACRDVILQRQSLLRSRRMRFYQWARERKRWNALAWRLAGYHHLVRLYFHFARQARGMDRILEKSPAHVNYLNQIKATFPKARVLCLYRHPLDVLNSYRKRLHNQEKAGRSAGEQAWLKISVADFAAEYTRQTQSMLDEQASNQAGFMPVKYEDLTTQPTVELERVCQFIDEPFDLAKLHEDVPEKRRKIDGSPGEVGRILANPTHWEKYTRVDEARELEDRLADVMATLKFPRYCE